MSNLMCAIIGAAAGYLMYYGMQEKDVKELVVGFILMLISIAGSLL